MSSLINNLNSILETKEEIKEILGTDSDIFADYPSYIQTAIASGGATGYAYITTNGDHNIATYAMVNVNVPQQEVPVVPPGYTYVYGTYNITANGTVDISSYADAYVNVPIPEQYIIPSGTAYITTNGDFDIHEFAALNVAVPSEATGYAYLTTNGDFDISSYAMVNVAVESTASGYAYITTNGDHNIAAYEMVNVEVPIPAGYIVPSGKLQITGNMDDIDITEYAALDVAVPVPAGYIVPSGTIDIEENGTFIVNSYENAYVHVPASVIEVIPDGYTYVYGGKEITANANNIDIASYSYVDVNVPVPSGYVLPSGVLYINENGWGINVSTYAAVDVTVNPSVSGTYYATENGTYDISQYEYVDVQVSGGGQESYTWSGLTANGNPGIIISNDVGAKNGGSNLAVQITSGGWWPTTDYYQIISNRQFCYQLPTSVTGHKWSDYATNSYILNTYGGTTYAWDPTTWDSLTDATQADTSANKQNSYSYVITNPDVYYLQASNASRIYPWGGNVMYQNKITDFKINSVESIDGNDWVTEIASIPVMQNDINNYGSYIAETSYFEGVTDISNLAGRNWKIAVTEYQNRWSLMDIVGPVAGSEVYLNDIDDVWANWDGGWNSGTTTYNTNTNCLELTYSKFTYTGNMQSSFNLYQLEYRLESGGSSRRIRLVGDEPVPTADLSNLSGTTYMTVVHKSGTSNPEENVLYLDASEFNGSSTYTGYQIDMKLCIPHDMWHYGSANHNRCWVEWIITPDDTPLATKTVTGVRNFIGTSWTSSGSRTTGSSDGDGHYVVTVSKSKSYTQLTTYKDYEFRVSDSLGGYTDYVPDLATPIAVDHTNLTGSQTISFVTKSDNNGVQLLNLDTSDIETELGKTSGTGVWTITINEDDFFDSTSANYLKGTLEWTIS